ncbi:MAG: GNAT family N-acetyltransferase [Patescibacteria group bacterium]
MPKEPRQKITIKNLADCPKYIPAVAKLLWQQWDKRHGKTLAEAKYRTKHCLTKKCPQTLVAFYGRQLAGTVSLRGADHPYRQDLGPWLSSLVVSEKYRNCGIGQKLQTELLKTARRAGFKKIYLFTELHNYYEKTNWKFVETCLYTEGRKVSIYEYKL